MAALATIEVDEDLAIRNELERKYADALANVAAKMDTEEISKEAAVVAFEAVYQTVSGLVAWEDLNSIMEEVNKIVPEPLRTRYVITRNGQVMTLEVRRENLHIAHLTGEDLKAQVNKYLSQADAFNEAERIVHNLAARGWKEIP